MSEQEAAELEEVYLSSDELNDELQAAERELIDRYVEGSLSKTERERFENFFLCSPGRKEKLRFARALRAYGEKSETNAVVPAFTLKSFTRSYAGMALFAVLLIAVAILAWRVFLFKSAEQETLAALTKAHTNGRLFESRISGLDYAPMAQARGENLDVTRLTEAELLALKEERENPGAPAFHTLGRVYLAQQKFDKALEWLNKAAEARPEDARIQSDLGAAFLEQGRQEADLTKRAEALITSLDHFDKALRLDDSLLEARFNRALLYEQMHLPERAKAEWQRYLEKDPNSGWAVEARKRLALLEQRQSRGPNNGDFDAFIVAAQNGDEPAAWTILSRNRTRRDNAITQRLIDQYFDLLERNSTEAGATLLMISLAGKLELEKTGDRFTSDLAAHYLKATPRQRELVRQGRTLLKSGLKLYENAEFEDAAQVYGRAESAFAHAGDTSEALMAQALIASSYLRVPYADRALALLKQLAANSSNRGYKRLLARALISVSDAENSRREFSKSLESAAQALDLYESVQDASGEFWSLQALVASYQEFGELYKSTGFAFRALDVGASLSPQPFEVWPLYQQTAFNLNALGFSSIALGFEEAALRLAVESGMPLLRSRSYALLASIHQKLHNYEAALKNGQLALDEANAVKGVTIKANLVAHSTLNLAHIHREMKAYAEALPLYNRSIELHQQLNQLLYVAEAHKGKLESLIALQDYRAAGEEIKTTIALLEQDRSRITEDANRNSYFDLAQSTYDLAVDFTYFNLQDSKAAFGYSEASHARSLLDLVSGGGEVVNARGGMDLRAPKVFRPLTLDEIQRRLPEQSQILQYSVLEDKLVAWMISKTAIESTHVRVSLPELTANVTGFISALTATPPRNIDEINKRAKTLYDVVIRPVKPSLNTGAVVFIVPDKILNIVPFGALVCPETGKHFVEDYVFAVAPSANVMILSSDNAVARSGSREESALVVGNPSFDVVKFPLFPDLPAAAREAESVAALYGAAPLSGTNAQAQRVKARLPEADVIHFAGHYVADERSPLRSKLLLSKAAYEQDGVLTAADVYALNLKRARLVVLSACTTGVERYYRGEGAIGMARPFIEAGAPLVVASLWSVESEPTSRLMLGFHKHRKLDRMSTIRALRQAQLDMMSSPDPVDRDPHTWAAFVAIGGFAE
ncbi:MAG TPA: CHAT domain-containing protein [Pyrinomonadaceae bacterium]|nr:CHAT domain-containing protein [Pyrinomonadaceae bacterium]